MRTQTPQTQEKSGPGLRQETTGPLSNSNTYQEASAMSDTTAQRPSEADLTAAVERRIGRKAPTLRDVAAYAEEHGTKASEVVDQAQRDVTGEWHPSWCSREDNCYEGSGTVDRVHMSEPAMFRRDVGTYGAREDGEAFTASVRIWLHHDAYQQEDMDDWSLTAQVKVQSEEGVDEADINMSPDRMRDLADFLFVAAEEIDAWRENSAAEEVAGHE